jgi:hypothetical protein
MDKEDKKYYGKLLKRLSYVVGSAFLIGYGANKCNSNNFSQSNLEENVKNLEFEEDSLKIFKNYPVKFKK